MGRITEIVIFVALLTSTATEIMNSNLTSNIDIVPIFRYRGLRNESGISPESYTRPGANATAQDPIILYHIRLRSAHSELGKRLRQQQIRYLLRSKSGKWEELHRSGLDATANGKWNPSAKVKVIIHGYAPPEYEKSVDIIRNTLIYQIGDAYGASGIAYNIIVVDWTSLSTETLYRYEEAAMSTAYTGEDVAEFLRKLKILGLILSWEDVHIVGHSLGAHVAGVVGAAIEHFSGGFKLGRITGLDPAGHLFEYNGTDLPNQPRALRKSDANFVDVIHCNMVAKSTTRNYGFVRARLGTVVQSGHADFYPDGGERQKNCTSISKYFTSCPCQSWDEFKGGKCPCSRNDGFEVAMGEQCSNRARGKYYRFM